MISAPLQFPVNSDDGDIQCENITITDDTLFEGNETFTVTLTTSTPRVDIMNDETSITIIDNEGTYIVWSVNMCHWRRKMVWAKGTATINDPHSLAFISLQTCFPKFQKILGLQPPPHPAQFPTTMCVRLSMLTNKDFGRVQQYIEQ